MVLKRGVFNIIPKDLYASSLGMAEFPNMFQLALEEQK